MRRRASPRRRPPNKMMMAIQIIVMLIVLVFILKFSGRIGSSTEALVDALGTSPEDISVEAPEADTGVNDDPSFKAPDTEEPD